jgi:hypothetical protein
MQKKLPGLGLCSVFVRYLPKPVPIYRQKRKRYREANMMDYRDNSFDLETPLCSFGPGGEFTAKWGELLKGEPAPQTRLGRVLSILAEVVTATAASGLPDEIELTDEPEDQMPATPNIRIVQTETHKGVHIKAVPAANAKAVRIVEDGGPVPGQLLLFGLNAGVSGQPGNKPDDSVRAYSRPAKKKSPVSRPRQGTLFEADTSRAIPA